MFCADWQELPRNPLVRVMRLPHAAALILTVLLAWAAPARADIQLVFGVYPSEKPSKMVKRFRPALDAIETRMTRDLGEEVEIKTQVLSGYKKGLESLVIGEVDFARLGPASYVMGKRENPGITLLSLESEKGTIAFDGVIVVRDDTDITEVAHLKGRTFAFGSKRSTLGRYFAQTYLANLGIHAKDLGDYDYLSHHEAVGLAVGAGRYEAGVLNRRKFEELQRRGVRLREIASFENVTRAWVARSGLEPRVQASLRAALLSIEDPEVLQALGFDGFLPGRDVDFDKTRRALVDYAQFQE